MLWPIVGGLIIAGVLVLRGAQRRSGKITGEDRARRLRELEERQRRELGEELVPRLPDAAEAESGERRVLERSSP
jgi:hypothetical protein